MGSQSPALKKLVFGEMMEAVNGCTVWDDVTEATFARFGQYVYTGDYDGAEPFEPPALESESSVSEPAPLTAQNQVDSNDTLANFARQRTKKKKREWKGGEVVLEPSEDADGAATPLARKDAWKSFTEERSYECGVAGIYFAPRNGNNLTEYKEVFLSHARVHMMADYYDIQPLAQLALHKLHRTLCKFTLHDDRIGDVVSLLRFCFEEDERPLLRELVSTFAACHFKQLWTSLEFQDLFASCGELSVAVMSNLVQRLD